MFLLALAIVDDLGAVLVIALFYTDGINLGALLLSFLVWAGALAYGRFGGGKALAFALIGPVMWYFMLKSGVHATIAGVLMALAVPLRHRLPPQQLQQELRALTPGRRFEQVEAVIEHLEDVLERAHSPLHKIEHALAPCVAFLIMPVFAFFNAGVALGGGETELISAVSIGAFARPAAGQADRRRRVRRAGGQDRADAAARRHSWQGLIGVGLLAGIGFTMSLFIASLAFPDAELLPGQDGRAVRFGGRCAGGARLPAPRPAARQYPRRLSLARRDVIWRRVEASSLQRDGGRAMTRDLSLFALDASRDFGERIAGHLGIALSGHEERAFEDGEHKARPLVNVRGRDVFVVQSLYGDADETVNDKLCKLLFFIGTLRDASAARVTAVVPYLAYARKDRKTQARDPVTTRYVAALFEAVNVDRLLSMDVHNLAAFRTRSAAPPIISRRARCSRSTSQERSATSRSWCCRPMSAG